MSIYDELENQWGTKVFLVVPARKSSKSKAALDSLVKSTVPGYKLHCVQTAGTYGNMAAIQDACEYNSSLCLFALGAYVGGDALLQELSTSMYDPSCAISVPKYVENASPRCLNQTIPLPYHIPGGISEKDLLELEHECLRCLHKKLIVQRFSGQQPYKALLLELVQGGNGSTLSHPFLRQLGRLCKEQSVVIIVDEVLTGGRSGLNNQMVMTLSMPEEFQDAVKYITMGKFVGCSLVLKKIPKKPTEAEEKLRGTSTEMECGYACALWEKVRRSVNNGDIQVRAREVLAAFKIDYDSDDWWGVGCLLFSNVKRPQTMTALKNRMLPLFDLGLRVRKQRTQKSHYTREYVTNEIVAVTQEWLIAHASAYRRGLQTCFVSPLVDKLFANGAKILEGKDNEEAGYFRVRPEDVVNFIGPRTAEKMAHECRLLKVAEGAGVCRMKARKFVQEAILVASRVKLDDGSPLAYKKKKTSARTEYTFLSAALFGTLGADGNFQFFS